MGSDLNYSAEQVGKPPFEANNPEYFLDDQLKKLVEFHEVFRGYMEIEPNPSIPADVTAMRIRLLQEELDEYREAVGREDLVEIADALIDLLYVLFGTIVSHGLQNYAEALFAEVHRSNMSKLDMDGVPIFRQDGKVLKSDLFSPPNLKRILWPDSQPNARNYGDRSLPSTN